MIKEAIVKLSKKENLTYQEAETVMDEIMSGQATPVQMSSYLTALSMKGETFDEMATSLEKDMKHEKRLTSDVAHELRTPLMAMLATVEAMQYGVYPSDDEHLETVASETRRLARLVQQMLDLSRMENSTFSSSVSAAVPVSDTPSASVTSNAGAPVCASS